MPTAIAAPITIPIAADARRVTPAVVEAVALGRLAVREPFETLEHHDHRDDGGWHRTPTLLLEQVSEGLVGEELVTLAVQEGVDRLLVERLVAEPGHVVEQVTLLVRHTQRHGSLHLENYNDVILSDTGPERESILRGLSVRGHTKDTSHLVRSPLKRHRSDACRLVDPQERWCTKRSVPQISRSMTMERAHSRNDSGRLQSFCWNPTSMKNGPY